MKKVLISILSLIFIISMITTVYAATGSISSSTSSDTVVKGKTFTVTLAGVSDSPIDGMYTKFVYDKNVLELVSATPGQNYGNNSSEGEILVTNNSSQTSPTSATLYTITFKVLDNANVESTTITFSESALHLNVEGTVNDFATEINNVTIDIKADDTTAGNQGNTDEQPEDTDQTPSNGTDGGDNSDGNTDTGSGNEDTNTKQDVSSSKDTNKNKNTNKNTTKLPQTGVESASIIAIIALGAISISSYVSYKKYKNI